MSEEQKKGLISNMEAVLQGQKIPEITQALLNLAEFMEHCDSKVYIVTIVLINTVGVRFTDGYHAKNKNSLPGLSHGVEASFKPYILCHVLHRSFVNSVMILFILWLCSTGVCAHSGFCF